MKKYLRVFVAVIMMLTSIIILSACKPKIEKGYIKTGTLETIIIKGEELDTSKAIAVYTYSDNTVIEVSAEDLTFGAFDSSEIGTKKLTVTYENYTFEVSIKVVPTEADVNSITSLESELINEFNEKRSSQEEKTEEFLYKNEPLYVGDDNAFDFRIFATGIDGNGQLQTGLTKVRTNIIVKLKTEAGEQLIPDEELSNYVSIDTENTLLDFTENAIGKDFKVEVSAVNRNELYENNPTSFNAILKVVDGYNVYNARDLSVYDNTYSSYDNIRPTNAKVNAVILQNDILVTKDDVRSDMFWTTSHPNYSSVKALTDQTIEGTPIDYAMTGIYHRKLQSGETFNLFGNYFKIDLSKFPKMVIESDDGGNDKKGVNVEKGEYMTSHFSLFYNENISEVTDGNKDNLLPSQLNHKNVYFYGNGERNATPENSGSLIGCKVTKTNYLAKNNIFRNFYITNFFIQDDYIGTDEGYNVIDSCKAYNSYQTLLYSWGCKSLKIVNSEYIGAGGPAFIVDHVSPKSDNGGYPSNIDCINTKVESVVSGKEPWFVTYGASDIVMQLMTADQLFSGFSPSTENSSFVANGLPQNNKTIINNTYKDDAGNTVGRLNLMVAMKSGSAQGLTAEKIKGYVRMFDRIEDYNAYYGINVAERRNTTYGLDFTKSDEDGSLPSKAYLKDLNFTTNENGEQVLTGGSLYFESNKSGGYINANVANNKDASFVKPVTLYTIINTIANGGTENKEETASFQTKDIEQMKLILKEKLTALKEAGAISNVYLYSVNYGLITNSESDNTDELKLDKLLSLVDTFVSHADGKYVNIYMFNGMGAMIELYPSK